MADKTIVVTGASGFVGSAVLVKAATTGNKIVAISRTPLANNAAAVQVQIPELNGDTNWQPVLAKGDVEVIIHAAARVHQMQEDAVEPLLAYREVNTAGTVNLARQAAAAGVKRFIFISSIKVNGEATAPGRPFTHDDTPQPQDPYGVSKAEAEAGLKQLASDSGMEIVIIRPPLVYGKGVKANFATMLKWAQKNLPLPLGAIHNRRSMVALDNLVDLIVTCIDHPNAANQTFLVSDNQDVSTSELLQMMTVAAGKKPRLIPVPVSWLKLLGKVTGKQAIIDRLCGNLQLDIEHTKATLSWTPPVTVEQGIRCCFVEK